MKVKVMRIPKMQKNFNRVSYRRVLRLYVLGLYFTFKLGTYG